MNEREKSSEILLAMFRQVGDRELQLVEQYLAQNGFRLPKDGPTAIVEMKRRAASEIPEAQFALAKFLVTGLYVNEDKIAALEACRLAASNGFAPALVMLAGFYESGWAGLTPDVSAAVSLERQAASLGYVGGLSAVANRYATGSGLPKDIPIAIEWYERAAQLGDKFSQFQLGSLYTDNGASQDQFKGVAWIEHSARQNYPPALRWLSEAYRTGTHGFRADPDAANIYLERARAVEDGD